MKYLLLAVGGYLLYEYFYGSTSAPAGPVASTTVPNVATATTQPSIQNTASSGGPIVPTNSTPSMSLVSTSVQSQLQAFANAYAAANNGAGLNVDQWNYYLSQVTGVQVNPVQGEAIIQALGESDSNRSTVIPLSVYITALSNSGLGRLGMNFVRGMQGLGLLVSY